ncbi:protein FAR1-RELATED SEQUENCE 5-like [Bidens hawaiensis]|uniref:protein FAR1-RELATED SEQUENCE 5-like n=1 Tax=Bidens hawaiensis TaxID=980011 RepID=UPI00404B38AD
MVFESIDLVYDFYCEYAKKTGFCVRKEGSYMNDGILKSKYFTCSKEGHKPPKNYDSMDDKDSSKRQYYKRRKRPTIQCGCRAQIFLKSVDGIKFEINEFVEGHNHAMVEEEDMHFVRSNRKLTHVQEDILYELSTLNLGPVKAFNILRQSMEVLKKLGLQKIILTRLFWADEISKKNCLASGDIIVFDATFKTNKYKVVFVPFTAI